MVFVQAAALAENYSQHASTKVGGLLRLLQLGARVPDFGALFDGEVEHFRQNGAISDPAKAMLARFIEEVSARGEPALFALRFDYKSDDLVKRPPISNLNVGQLALPGSVIALADGVEIDLAKVKPLEAERQFIPAIDHRYVSPADEVIEAAEQCFARLLESDPQAPECSLIVQRMVFGVAQGKSGNGIACNYPEDVAGPKRAVGCRDFRGIFLPNQQGIQVRAGAWGTPQMDLAELKLFDAEAYTELEALFRKAQTIFGPDPYFEFTLESGRLYLLQHQERVRFVADD